jgi:hypothetical protein
MIKLPGRHRRNARATDARGQLQDGGTPCGQAGAVAAVERGAALRWTERHYPHTRQRMKGRCNGAGSAPGCFVDLGGLFRVPLGERVVSGRGACRRVGRKATVTVWGRDAPETGGVGAGLDRGVGRRPVYKRDVGVGHGGRCWGLHLSTAPQRWPGDGRWPRGTGPREGRAVGIQKKETGGERERDNSGNSFHHK